MSDGNAVITPAAGERWRGPLLALCAFSFFFIAANVYTDTHLNADAGLSAEPTRTPLIDRVTAAPGGDAARGGIQTGDLIDVSRLDPAVRYRIYNGFRVDEPVAVAVRRGYRDLVVTIVPRYVAPVSWETWLAYAGEVWITLFCAILAWRRSNSAAARALVLYLLLTFVVSQAFGDVSTPWPWLDYACLAVKGVLFPLGFAFIPLYAGQFARPISALRRSLTVFAFTVAAVAAGCAQWFYLAATRGRIDPFMQVLLIRSSPLSRFAFVVLLVTALAALLAALRASRDAERTRLIWGISGIAPFVVWGAIAAMAGESIPLVTFEVIGGICWFVTPAILTYSLVNRRLFDIGFLVNRAAVFTGVSVVVVGAFILVEWLLSDWLRDASHTTNVLVSGGLALMLGLSIRFVHIRIDRAVDNVFFRRRHEDERAIRTFAAEASYIGDPEILLERARAVLDRHTNAGSVEIVLKYDENDPAIVRMRAFPQPLDLHGFLTALHGDMAFPMIARGRFIGAIVLGARASGETYAPDEVSAISVLAHSTATALDAFGSHDGSDTVSERILTSIDALRSEILRRLPAVGPDTVV